MGRFPPFRSFENLASEARRGTSAAGDQNSLDLGFKPFLAQDEPTAGRRPSLPFDEGIIKGETGFSGVEPRPQESMQVSGVVALLVVLLLAGSAGALSPSVANPGRHPAPDLGVGWINISAVGSYGYQPQFLQQVPTNSTIMVTFTDKSPLAHTFTIIGKEGWVVPSSYNYVQINQLAYGHSPPALVNLNVSGPGDTNFTTFTSHGPGWYEFLCATSGHFQLGMYGFVAFGMNLPSNLTGSNRTGVGGGLSFGPVDAAIVGGVIVLLVVGFVALNRWRDRARRRT